MTCSKSSEPPCRRYSQDDAASLFPRSGCYTQFTDLVKDDQLPLCAHIFVFNFTGRTSQVEPLASTDRANEELKWAEGELAKSRVDNAKVAKVKMELKERNASLLLQINDLRLQVRAKEDAVCELEEKIKRLVAQNANNDQLIKELREKSVKMGGTIAQMEAGRSLEEDGESQRKKNEDLEQEKRSKEEKIERLVAQNANSDKLIKELREKSVKMEGTIVQMEVEKRLLEEDSESQRKKNEDLEQKKRSKDDQILRLSGEVSQLMQTKDKNGTVYQETLFLLLGSKHISKW